MKRVTYFIGAGASINAIPAVNQLKARFEFFSRHVVEYASKNGSNIKASDSVLLKQILDEVALGISTHYTIDTYAKKLFLKRGEEKKYFNLEKCLTGFFLYEQLRKDKNERCNSYIKEKVEPVIDFAEDKDIDFVDKVCTSQDYRYDSFFATVLNDINGSLKMPEGINIISWNYDFQIEIAYSNYSNSSLNETESDLNIYGALGGRKFDPCRAGVIKLNGSAGFVSSKGNFGEIFDFKEHSLDSQGLKIIVDIILQSRQETKSALRFAWNENELSKNARTYAQQIISESEVIVIIGYSFPYFNREVDRFIFKGLDSSRKPIVYLQVPENSYQSVNDRFEGVYNLGRSLRKYTETDQFLIPNEL